MTYFVYNKSGKRGLHLYKQIHTTKSQHNVQNINVNKTYIVTLQ